MYITLVFLGVIMATVIGWLLRQSLNTQPWVSDPAADAVTGASMSTNTKTVALTVFLAVATSVFALFVSAYTIRMEEPDWRPVSEPASLPGVATPGSLLPAGASRPGIAIVRVGSRA